MKLTPYFKQFFKEHEDDLNNFKFAELYSSLRKDLTAINEPVAMLTNAIRSIGIDPLNYLTDVPIKYLYCSTESLRDMTTIPSHIKTIGNNAFANTDLHTFKIPEGVEHIGARSFAGCWELKAVMFPSTLKTIDRAAFTRCAELKKIIYNGTKEDWENINKDTAWLFLTRTHGVDIICTDGKVSAS